ncbi:MAG: sulfatase, partial [Verrucomicrobia bacterium]|nr:sulfatase [Verrucomicrobiota bacterium]
VLAKRGVQFNNAQCQAPICNPSRASMFTGLLPSTTGIYFLGPDFRSVERTREAETLFQYFYRNGYDLSTRGKIFHGRMAKVDQASFDENSPAKRGTPWPKEKLSYDKPNSSKLWDWGAWYEKDSDVKDYLTAEWAAQKFQKLAQQDKPFFMALGFSLPHVPLYVPQKWFDMYPLESLKLPETMKGDMDDISKYAIRLIHSGAAPRHSWLVENDEWKHAVQAYLASTSFVDHCVGMALKGLEESGLAENTIVVAWGDHGFHLGEKERWAKRSLWEESARVPLIIAGPGIQKNVLCERPVGLIDIYPTLVDYCGLKEKQGLEGISIVPLLGNPQMKWGRPALTTFGPNNHTLRTERWRYIQYDDGSKELYDHRKDTHEFKNLASDPQYADVIAGFVKALPKVNVPPAPGSSGSGTPIYREIEKPVDKAKKK